MIIPVFRRESPLKCPECKSELDLYGMISSHVSTFGRADQKCPSCKTSFLFSKSCLANRIILSGTLFLVSIIVSVVLSIAYREAWVILIGSASLMILSGLLLVVCVRRCKIVTEDDGKVVWDFCGMVTSTFSTVH